MLGAPIVIGIIFIILLLISPCIFKCAFKTQNFFGFRQGVCCSFITLLTILAGYLIGVMLFSFFVINSKDTTGNTIAIAGMSLLFLFFIIALVYLSIFFILLCYTKQVSDPYPYNSIFMFISGYTMFSFILIYTFIVTICLYINLFSTYGIENNINNINNTAFSIFNIGSSFVLVLFEFIIFGQILNLSGISILFMLHHRKVNSIMFCLACGIYFGPFLIYFIEVIFEWVSVLEYSSFLFGLASIVLGCCFYSKYANTASPSDLIGQSLYEMKA